jgi:2-hydroxychromene-2-carboxylate isomerase
LRKFSFGTTLRKLMGDLILLSDRFTDDVAFYFDVGCPFSYLAAERVERLLGEVEWVPAPTVGLDDDEVVLAPEARARAERRAAELRLPLVWPDRPSCGLSSALRAASFASSVGEGARFALAATRLAFCGGFDLDDPELLIEAAAAAGIRPEDCFAAIADGTPDESLRAGARALASAGVRELPAVRIGRRFLAGERRLAEAAAALGGTCAAFGGPLAPAG